MEVWKEIPGFEGMYEASNLGNIRSVERRIQQVSRSGNSYERVMPTRPIVPRIDTSGRYFYVNLSKNGEAKNQAVHRLVLLAFEGKPPFENAEGCHGDGNSRNNAISNLRWGTHMDNEADKNAHGTRLRGEDHYASVISDAVVAAIKVTDFSKRGMRAATARALGVKRQVVESIISGKAWSWLDPENYLEADQFKEAMAAIKMAASLTA